MQRIFSTLALVVVCLTTAGGQALRVGYYGETVTHYGLKAAYERSLHSYVKQRNRACKTFLFAPGLALYRHPANHYGMIISPEFAYRRIGRRGGMVEVGIAPAYFRYFLDAKTYKVADNGEFRRVPMAGGDAFLPTVSVGVGRDLSVRRTVPLMWFTRLNLMQQRPYNTSSLLRFSLEAGINLPLKKS
ncbi:hypothetical protein BN8_03314 [Fibrisoma limi BUZ 3]|uniref:Outer membrane protein beta-barrel domain-containing protein n=1 Tax=Fibrisoma limi BUZ 3 TaxID=1185876 RepID=I2GJU4_9BACT|nr:hypothetical protein [Fibrisoma limi]CCH54169.1 hypothetical protein BN8_03314 [Fibrisoma limi BUZ 3]